MSPKRIALMNIESFSSGLAIRRLIEQESQKIAIVICSKKHLQSGLIRAAIENYRRSGFRFTVFLFLNFTMYYWVSSLWDTFDRIVGSSRPPRRIKALCKSHNIPYVAVTDVNAESTLALLRKQDVDMILVYYFEQILKSGILAIPPMGAVNAHAALLPSYRGLFPVFRATQFGEIEAGMTLHEIPDEGIDAGPILDQIEIALPENLDALSRSRHVNFAGVDRIRAALGNLANLRDQKRAQTGTASYYTFPTPADAAMCRQNGHRVTSLWRFVRETVRS